MAFDSSVRLLDGGDFPRNIGMGICQFCSRHHETSATIAVVSQSWLCNNYRGSWYDILQYRYPTDWSHWFGLFQHRTAPVFGHNDHRLDTGCSRQYYNIEA